MGKKGISFKGSNRSRLQWLHGRVDWVRVQVDRLPEVMIGDDETIIRKCDLVAELREIDGTIRAALYGR